MRAELHQFIEGDYEFSTDPERVDLEVVHRCLSELSYWAAGRSFELVERSWANTALVGGAYAADGSLAGFARMVTDLSTFGWLCDVMVVPEYRGTGVGVGVVRLLVEHPQMEGIKRQILATADAHELYRKFDYVDLDAPEMWMLRTRGEISWD